LTEAFDGYAENIAAMNSKALVSALSESGKEDAARSRRVEFKIRTDAETRIAKILEVARTAADSP
jgi:hypothetical protein